MTLGRNLLLPILLLALAACIPAEEARIRAWSAGPEERPVPEDRPPRGAGVEVGRRYPMTLDTHCGLRDIRLNGFWWIAHPQLGEGNPPRDWWPADHRGEVLLVQHDVALFFTESGRTLVFRPWPDDLPWHPCE